ncbi:MAG: histidine kinase, partial [Nakamurella sp.]
CSVAMAALLAAPALTGLEAAGFADPVPAILLPSSGVYLVLLYSIAAVGVGRTPLLALLIAGLGVILTAVKLLSAQLISTVAPTGWPVPLIVIGALLAAVIAAWSLGRFRRLRQDYVLSLAERARQAEADRALRAQQAAQLERARIAREMHDVVSHSLAVMIAQAEAGRMAGGKDPALGIAVLPTIAATGRAAMTDMRSLLGVLRDDRSVHAAAEANAIEHQPAETSAPQPRTADIPALVERSAAAGLPVRVEETGQPVDLSPAAELTAYRVVQEALTNVVKHGRRTTSVVVELIWTPSSLTIRIENRGGPAAVNARTGDGQGLRGMRERVAAVGGALTAGPTVRGFQVVADIPARAPLDAAV